MRPPGAVTRINSSTTASGSLKVFEDHIRSHQVEGPCGERHFFHCGSTDSTADLRLFECRQVEVATELLSPPFEKHPVPSAAPWRKRLAPAAGVEPSANRASLH